MANLCAEVGKALSDAGDDDIPYTLPRRPRPIDLKRKVTRLMADRSYGSPGEES